MSLNKSEDHSQRHGHWHATEIYGGSLSGAQLQSDLTATLIHGTNRDDDHDDDICY